MNSYSCGNACRIQPYTLGSDCRSSASGDSRSGLVRIPCRQHRVVKISPVARNDDEPARIVRVSGQLARQIGLALIHIGRNGLKGVTVRVGALPNAGQERVVSLGQAWLEVKSELASGMNRIHSFLYFPVADQASTVPTAMRFPKMIQPLKFADEIIGAAVTVVYGIGDIVLETCNVNNFRVECKEGGTVRVTYRVQGNPSGEQLAKLSQMLGLIVDVSIAPPMANIEQQQGEFREAA